MEDVTGVKPVIVFHYGSFLGWMEMNYIRIPILHPANHYLKTLDVECLRRQKKWASFFVSDERNSQAPSTHIYFVQWFVPLIVQECSSYTEFCEFVHQRGLAVDNNEMNTVRL